MNSKLITIIFFTLIATPSHSQIGREVEEMLLPTAKIAGACKINDHLRFLEEWYNICRATTNQFQKLYDIYDNHGIEGEISQNDCAVVLTVLNDFSSRWRAVNRIGGYTCF